MNNARIFYGIVQPDENDRHWKRAGERYDQIIEDDRADRGSEVILAMLSEHEASKAICYVSILSSEISCDDALHTELDVEWMAQQPLEQWSRMIEDWCSEMGVQLYDQKPGWHLAKA